jgi:hypothetical protein
MIDLASAGPAQVQGGMRDVLKKIVAHGRETPPEPPDNVINLMNDCSRARKLRRPDQNDGWLCRKRYGRRLDPALTDLSRLPS